MEKPRTFTNRLIGLPAKAKDKNILSKNNGWMWWAVERTLIKENASGKLAKLYSE